jgi:hypothetical protein
VVGLRAARALALLLAAARAGCGGGPPSPESVVRAWSQAVNEGDNERAAEMFAVGARVIQAGRVLELESREQAVDWNARLPCSGKIVSLSTDGDTATATFLLGDREASPCDSPGVRAMAFFRVRRGKIVLWHQMSSGGSPRSNRI